LDLIKLNESLNFHLIFTGFPCFSPAFHYTPVNCENSVPPDVIPDIK